MFRRWRLIGWADRLQPDRVGSPEDGHEGGDEEDGDDGETDESEAIAANPSPGVGEQRDLLRHLIRDDFEFRLRAGCGAGHYERFLGRRRGERRSRSDLTTP